jgi:hypothetical protein
MDGNIVANIIDNYGIIGIIILIFSTIVLTIFVKSISHITWLAIPFYRFKEKELLRLDEHLFFEHVKVKLRYEIPYLELVKNKKVTQQVYRDIMYMTIEAFYYGCKHLIETPKIDALSKDEWASLVKLEISSILRSYEDKAENFGIPFVIIKKYSKWLQQYIDTLNEYVLQLSIFKSFNNSVDRTNIFLLVMDLLMVTMIGDLHTLAEDEDEFLSGTLYRGTPLE